MAWYRQKLLAGTEKEISQIFNEDFYLPLYLPLWCIPMTESAACVQGEEWEQHEEVHRWAEVPGHETGQGEGETQKGDGKKSIQIDLGAVNIFSE